MSKPWRCLYGLACCLKATSPLARMRPESEVREQCEVSLRLVDLAILAGALIDLDGMNPALVHALATALHTVLTAPPEVAQTTQHQGEKIERGERGAGATREKRGAGVSDLSACGGTTAKRTRFECPDCDGGRIQVLAKGAAELAGVVVGAGRGEKVETIDCQDVCAFALSFLGRRCPCASSICRHVIFFLVV